MSRIEHLARTYWFDLLIALLAIVAILDVALGRGSPGAPTTTLWFCLPALAILVLPIFARRWFPFAGPAAYWLLAAGISFVDPLLIPYPEALFPIGLAAAFLLGNLRDLRQAGVGLAVVIGAAATLVYNIPGHSVSQLVFIPLDFAISWVAGVAVRARALLLSHEPGEPGGDRVGQLGGLPVVGRLLAAGARPDVDQNDLLRLALHRLRKELGAASRIKPEAVLATATASKYKLTPSRAAAPKALPASKQPSPAPGNGTTTPAKAAPRARAKRAGAG